MLAYEYQMTVRCQMGQFKHHSTWSNYLQSMFAILSSIWEANLTLDAELKMQLGKKLEKPKWETDIQLRLIKRSFQQTSPQTSHIYSKALKHMKMEIIWPSPPFCLVIK